MKRISFEQINIRFRNTKEKVLKFLSSSFKVLTALLIAALVTFILWWLINRVIPRIGKEEPTPTPVASPTPRPEPIGPVESTESAQDKARLVPGNSQCCWNMLSGVWVGKPPSVECMEYEFGKSMRDMDRMLLALKDAGVVLFGTGGQREFNGFVSSRIGRESLSNYMIYVYSDNTINYEYDPPYVYRSTACTNELKAKIREKLDGIKATL